MTPIDSDRTATPGRPAKPAVLVDSIVAEPCCVFPVDGAEGGVKSDVAGSEGCAAIGAAVDGDAACLITRCTDGASGRIAATGGGGSGNSMKRASTRGDRADMLGALLTNMASIHIAHDHATKVSGAVQGSLCHGVSRRTACAPVNDVSRGRIISTAITVLQLAHEPAVPEPGFFPRWCVPAPR